MSINHLRSNWERDHTIFAGLLAVAWLCITYVHWFLVSHGYGGTGLFLGGGIIATVAAMWVIIQSLSRKTNFDDD